MTLWGIVLGTPDPAGLAEFYEQLLGWERRADEPEWVTSAPPDSKRPGLSFQLETGHIRPTWPAASGDQQMQIHLDIRVENVAAAGAFALELGATRAKVQPQPDVEVYLDPAGHPFCLFLQ